MGFTPFPYDITQQAVDDTYQNIINDSDLFSIHFDNGVPWNEALNDLPFPNNSMILIKPIPPYRLTN